MVRRVKRSEATDGTHVRMKIIAHNKGDLVRWRLVSMEDNQYGRHTSIESVPHVDRKRSQSQSHRTRASQDHRNPGRGSCIFSSRHGRREIRTSAPTEAEPDSTDVWLLIKAHHGTRKCACLWPEFLRNEVFLNAGWGAVAVEPSVYLKAGSVSDDDDACVCVHRDDSMVESRIDVVQDMKAMLEHKAVINVISIIGPGQGTEAKIVKRVEPCWFHVESESQARARFDRVGWI